MYKSSFYIKKRREWKNNEQSEGALMGKIKLFKVKEKMWKQQQQQHQTFKTCKVCIKAASKKKGVIICLILLLSLYRK